MPDYDCYIRMPFGKHKGRLLRDVPDDYLRWCLRECTNLSYGLRQAIGRHLGRQDSDVPAVASELIRDWYRDLALDYHPDRGGSVEAMQAINDAHKRLRELVKA